MIRFASRFKSRAFVLFGGNEGVAVTSMPMRVIKLYHLFTTLEFYVALTTGKFTNNHHSICLTHSHTYSRILLQLAKQSHFKSYPLPRRVVL